MWGSVKEIDAAELANWMEAEGSTLRVVDVREMREIERGIVPGAQAVPLATLPLRMSEFQPSEKLVMVCHSGARSAQACMFLQQQGFGEVYNLRGGMLGWAHNSLPIALPQAS